MQAYEKMVLPLEKMKTKFGSHLPYTLSMDFPIHREILSAKYATDNYFFVQKMYFQNEPSSILHPKLQETQMAPQSNAQPSPREQNHRILPQDENFR